MSHKMSPILVGTIHPKILAPVESTWLMGGRACTQACVFPQHYKTTQDIIFWHYEPKNYSALLWGLGKEHDQKHCFCWLVANICNLGKKENKIKKIKLEFVKHFYFMSFFPKFHILPPGPWIGWSYILTIFGPISWLKMKKMHNIQKLCHVKTVHSKVVLFVLFLVRKVFKIVKKYISYVM